MEQPLMPVAWKIRRQVTTVYRVEVFDNDEWRVWSIDFPGRDDVLEALARVRAARPESRYRPVKVTTTVEVLDG